MLNRILLSLCIALLTVFNGVSQEKLYPNTFPLGDVSLLDGPFKHARDLNIQTLLKYDVDRLLAPYRKEAGLPAKAKSFENWSGLDGHVGGHYLSALAINYAATGDTACKRRMDYMIYELKGCQAANARNNPTWGVGYVGGVPNSKSVWTSVKSADFKAFKSAWVPWYNLHKTYAGLRDAWNYGGNKTAKSMFLSFCDWGIRITSELSDAQMETMLQTEHGGMNEIFADAYQMTGQVNYLNAARRFSHKVFLNKLGAGMDNLDNVHANTQIPKIVGFQRIAELTHDSTYTTASAFFWETVTSKRSLALGGNSRREFFPSAPACSDYVNVPEGPESCNTNNMLKLTQDLFRMNPEAKYVDFYERALYNHILSTQHPDHGGYVYFTSARPRHYRVYSAPNEAMWCCVGTGMENHGKYGEFIYAHAHDTLFVNLFIASELNWKEKKVRIKQETAFPDEERTKLTFSVAAPTRFKLLIRHPSWVPVDAFKILIGKDTLNISSKPSSYIVLDRIWKGGEVVTVLLPMHPTLEQLPNVPDYVAVMQGPILLGAKTGTENLTGLIADGSRWGHIANGPLLPLDKAPIMVGDRRTLLSKLIPVAGKPLTFTAPGLFANKADSALVLEPFFRIHDARYMMYWLNLSKDQYKSVLDSLAIVQQAALELEARTLDKVVPGEQQPEVDHKMTSKNSYTGNYQNESWRDVRKGGFVRYSMLTRKQIDLSLMVRYWGNDKGNRAFDILIDGVKLVSEQISGKWNKSTFVNQEYPIPNSMTAGKDTILVQFQPDGADSTNVAGGIYFVRVLKPAATTQIPLELNKKLKTSAYLFVYFTGNKKDEEAIRFAVSNDGYHYWALNNNQPVVDSKVISSTGGVRDPHILRCEDGKTYYMVATDMVTANGWDSNRAMVLMKSTDLIHWTSNVVNIQKKYLGNEDLKRVWAPQTIFDAKVGKYLVYWSMKHGNTNDIIYYAYANPEFTDIEGTPKPLFIPKSGDLCIDGDIILKDGVYHLFRKTANKQGSGLKVATTTDLTSGIWMEDESYVQPTKEDVEGSGIFKLNNSESYVLMYDLYRKGKYQFTQSSDLEHFTIIDTEVSMNFKPRHGTVMPITRDELRALTKQWGLPAGYPEINNNPVLNGYYADPEVLYSNKTKKFYLYPTSDGFTDWSGTYFKAFSSENLIDWKDEGVILDLPKDVSWGKKNAWAPCIVEKKVKGKWRYFYYFTADKKIGVAVSDNPTGPFVDLGKPLIDTKPKGVRGGQIIDQDVFTDPKTGKSYLYWGNGFMAGAELNKDMTSIKESTLTLLTPKKTFREGTYVFYRKGLYYFLWSENDTRSEDYRVRYGTSKSPLGPIDVPDQNLVIAKDTAQGIYGTGHNSILQIPGKDEWYIVYHRFSYPDGIKMGRAAGYNREVCIDKMEFNADGSIRQVVPTHKGIAPVKASN